LNIALIQSDIFWEDIHANLKACTAVMGKISNPVDVVILPELFTTGFTMNTENLAESMEGNTIKWMAEMAGKHKCSIAGSVIISNGTGYYNRLIWMHRDGTCEYYDKRHLFRMGNEEAHYNPGNSLTTVREGAFRIRPLICYDLRFPVWSRNTDDYDILVYVANWPAQRRDVWISLLKARAIENQSYVIGVNRIGEDGMGITYTGDSRVYDPKGNTIAELHGSCSGILQVSLSLDKLKDFRTKFPVWKDADSFRIIK